MQQKAWQIYFLKIKDTNFRNESKTSLQNNLDMKKETIFKAKMLIPQEEMAMLLNVSRSQWSMHKIGYRGLPVKSREKFGFLLKVASELPLESLHRKTIEKQQIQEQLVKLEAELKDVVIKQFRLQKKYKETENKYQAAMRTIDFVNLALSKKKFVDFEYETLKRIERKAMETVKRYSLYEQTQLKIKLKTLELQHKLLEKALVNK